MLHTYDLDQGYQERVTLTEAMASGFLDSLPPTRTGEGQFKGAPVTRPLPPTYSHIRGRIWEHQLVESTLKTRTLNPTSHTAPLIYSAAYG